jgi:hypothetical protein
VGTAAVINALLYYMGSAIVCNVIMLPVSGAKMYLWHARGISYYTETQCCIMQALFPRWTDEIAAEDSWQFQWTSN